MPAPTSTLAPRPPRPPADPRRAARWRAVAAGAALATGAAGVVVPVATAPAASADTVAFCKELVSQAESFIDEWPEPGQEDEPATEGEDYTYEDAASDVIDEMAAAHQDEFEKYRDAWLEEPAGTEHHAQWAYRDYHRQRQSEIDAWNQGGQVGPRPPAPVEFDRYRDHYRAWAVDVQAMRAYEVSALKSLPLSADLADWACPPMEQQQNDRNRPTAYSKSQNRTVRTMTGNKLGLELERRLRQDRVAGNRAHVVGPEKPTLTTRQKMRSMGVSYSQHEARGTPSNPRAGGPAMKPGTQRSTSVVGDMAGRSGQNPADAKENRSIRNRLVQNSTRGTMPRLPGGIDWTSLELKYVTDDPKNDDYGYAFSADELPEPDGGEEPGYGGEASLNLSSDALFTWLALDPGQFWVNLNPDTPETIIDEQFATTDAGRVLLQADLAFKRTIADDMNPETETGEQFWESTERTEDGLICHDWYRFWVDPKAATVREDGDQLYILDAPLRAQIEPIDVEWELPGEDLCADAPQDVVDHNNKLLADTFAPLLEESVNNDAEYADLRRVYQARVAAQWLRERDAERPGAFQDVIDSGDVSDWPARTDWDPQDVFDDYMERIETPLYKYEWTHGEMEYWLEITGGVMLPDTPRDEMPAETFEREHPKLPRTVQDARFDTVSEPPEVAAQDDVSTLDDESTGTAWLGGGTVPQADGPDPEPTDPPDGGSDNPGGNDPGGDNPGGNDPGGNDPGGDNPGGDDGGGDNPGGDDGSGPGGGSGDDDAPGGGGREPLPPRADNPSYDVVPSSGPLPATGFDDVRLVYAALALVLAGLALMLARRRWLSRR